MKQIIPTLLMVLSVTSLFADGATEGRSLANTVSGHFRSDMTNTMVRPMTSSTDMATVDGARTFAGNVQCASTITNPYLQIGYSVDGYGEVILSSRMDTDLSGSYDRFDIRWADANGQALSPLNISGVCVNGVVSCNPGTWGSCRYFMWNGALGLQESQQSTLSTCQCVNSSCGSISVVQGAGILDRLATGAVNALMSVNTRYTISRVERTPTSILYWGQDYSNCNSNGMAYDNYTGPLENRGLQARTDASSDPLSATTIMQGSNYATESSTTQKLNYFGTNDFGTSTIDSGTSAKIFARQQTISSSTSSQQNANGGYTMAYTDTYTDSSGATVTRTDSASIQTSNETALKFCVVYWYAATPDAFSDNVTRNTTNITDEVKQLQSRECTSGICPVNSGEGIERDCSEGSQQQLIQVTARLKGVQEAANDMICSSF